MVPSIKQGLPAEKQKGVRTIVRTPFRTPCLQGIVCYTFQVNCRAVMSLPCVKGGGSRKRDGGIVKSKIVPKNNPSAAFGVSSLYTREPFFMFICNLSIFLTSTTFADTKAKPRAERGKILFYQIVLKIQIFFIVIKKAIVSG